MEEGGRVSSLSGYFGMDKVVFFDYNKRITGRRE
jgi:hypothetical protein